MSDASSPAASVDRPAAAVTTRVILQGDLSAIQLPDVLSFLSMIRPTGKLELRQRQLDRFIFWKGGEIVFATSNSPEDSLGQFLLRNGKITRQEYEESLKKLSPDTRHGKVLVQMGALSPKDLWWGVKNQILEIIYGLFLWKEGTFSFDETEGELVQERITLSINTSSIIMEGTRRVDETALIREKIPSLDLVFAKVAGAEPKVEELEFNQNEISVFERIDGRASVRELVRSAELTEFEVLQILYQLLSARIIEAVVVEKPEPVFLDVEDSPELLRLVSAYNGMFGRLFGALLGAVGEERGREIFMNVLQNSDTNELWTGVFFDQFGRFDENMLIANISELPFEKRQSVLDEGLNTLLSIQLFQVSQHLDASSKVQLFRFISDQKAQIEKGSA